MPASFALLIISPLLVITPISIWNNQQRILPLSGEKFALKLSVALAGLSVVLNIVLINFFGFLGTALSWLIVETVGMIVSVSYAHKKDPFNLLNMSQVKYLISGCIMGAIVLVLRNSTPITWSSLIICILSGVIVYFIALIIVKDKYIYKILKVSMKYLASDRNV